MARTIQTTLTLDRDLVEAARDRAAETGSTLDQLVSRLLRERLASDNDAPNPPEYRNGILLLPGRSPDTKVTVDDVNAILDAPE
jgi:hypothetical protein